MKTTETNPSRLRLDVRTVPDLETAIDRWLAARNEYKKQSNDENQYAYNAAYFALGEAWAEQHPKPFYILEAFGPADGRSALAAPYSG